jgi:periplasmic nitrate reductase NapE
VPRLPNLDAHQIQPLAAKENAASNRGEDVQQQPPVPAPEKSSELKAFLFLTIVMAPVLAGVIIGTYGLLVWIYQMFMGPPTG